MKKISW